MVDRGTYDIYNSYITKAITDIRTRSKRPEEKAITDYEVKNFAANIDESFIGHIKKLLDQNILEKKPFCKGNSFSIVAKENSENRMSSEVLTIQIRMPQIPELCDTPQIRKEENSFGETYTKHNEITLTNLTAEFMVSKHF